MIIRLSILMFKINQQGLDSLAKCSLMINDLCQSLYMEIFPMIFLTKILQKLSNWLINGKFCTMLILIGSFFL